MAGSLIFIEDVNEINAIKKYIFEDTIVIAMLPEVAIELNLKGIPFENTRLFFGLDGHRETLKHSKLIVERIRPLLDKIKFNGIQYSFEKTWIVYFRVNLNYLLSIIFIINRAIKIHCPNKIIVVRNNYKSHNSLNEVVEKYAESNGINIEYTNKIVSKNYQKKNKAVLMSWVFKLIFEFQLKLLSFLGRNRETSLVLDDSSNMPKFIKKITRQFDNFFPVYLSVQKSSLKIRLIEMLKGSSFSFMRVPINIPHNLRVIFRDNYDSFASEVKDFFLDSKKDITIYGVDLSDSMEFCVDNELKDRMTSLYGEILSLNRLIYKVRPKSSFAQHSLGIGYALGEISLKENIPGLLITHGSHVPQKDALPNYEWIVHAHTIFNGMYPFVAIQSPWAKKFFKKQDKVVSKTIDTGPLFFLKPSFDTKLNFKMRCKLFGKSNAQKRIILHASSPRAWKSYRPWVYETIDEYIHNINTIIKVIEQFPDLYFCIRFRPQFGLSLAEFKLSLKNSNCYGIYCEGLFNEFLMSSDLLISYSSTTIEEALYNKVPVLQYDPDGKYEHIKGEILSIDEKNSISPVYSVLSEKDLHPGISWWKKNHTKEINKNLDWQEHIYENIDNIEWLKIMGIK